jgi:hypothetical protein
MANIRKQFNFRNGVQVDDDNFIVNPNGLVGIGTSVPTEFLDVYGTAKVTGLVTTTNLAVTGVSDFFNDVKVGSGITLNPSTGVVNATTFVGSAAGLTDIFAIAVEGWIVNAGNISTTSNVGLGNTLPNYSLQVGEDPLIGNGLSIDAGAGDVNTTGIITASSFSGNINATSITSGTLDNSRLPQNIEVSGIITASSFSGIGESITAINATSITSGTLNNSRLSQTVSITNLNNTGIATLGIASASSLYVSGVTTSVGGFVGDVTGTASFASNLTGSPDITVSNITSANIISGVSSVGVSTVSTRLYAESIGVGTNSPSSDIHIRRSSQSRLQVTSDTAEAIVAVGRSTGLTGSNGALIFGNTAGIYPYSTEKTLDIVNYDTGNLNHYLHYGSTGVGTGNFNWIYTPDSTSTLMTLTYGGNLGVGITDPIDKLDVDGSAKIRQDLNVVGDIIATGAGSSTSVKTLYIIDGPSGLLDSNGNQIVDSSSSNQNINVTSGVSTFFDIQVTNNGIFDNKIGIGNSIPLESIHIGQDYIEYPENSLIINSFGIGIGTTSLRFELGLDAENTDAIFKSIGIGTTNPNGAENNRLYVNGPSILNGNVNISGVSTFTGAIDANGDLDVDGHTELDNVNITGFLTATSAFFSGNVSIAGTLTYEDVTNVDAIGIVTARSNVKVEGNLNVIGITTLASAGGITTTGGDLYVGSDLYVKDDIFFGEFNGRNAILSENLNVSGVSTFAGITTVTGPTLFTKQLNVSGVTTSANGFTSGIGVTNPVKITVSGNQLTFTVTGVGSTTLTLF